MLVLQITDKEEVPRLTLGNLHIRRIATRTGYSISHISKVFAHKCNPSVPCLRALADEFGLSLDEMEKLLRERKYNVPKAGKRKGRGDAGPK